MNDCVNYFSSYLRRIDDWYNLIRSGVECQYNNTESINLLLLFETLCNEIDICNEEGSIRLSNGADSREGRVEICLNGYWGTVCSAGWNERDALVACTQAGYQTLSKLMVSFIMITYLMCIGAIPVTNGYFGRGTGPVHMTGVDCTGSEESLTQCSYVNGIGATNCYHAKDVGVMCKGNFNINMLI